jgi:putative redox protein
VSEETQRRVDIERTATGRYRVRSARGNTIDVGTGAEDTFTPVELLLAAIGCCTAVDVDLVTSRRAEPTRFRLAVTGDKVRDETGGNRMVNLSVEFTVSFPEGEGGDAARQALPGLVRTSHDRLCTVSRTVEAGTPVRMEVVS